MQTVPSTKTHQFCPYLLTLQCFGAFCTLFFYSMLDGCLTKATNTSHLHAYHAHNMQGPQMCGVFIFLPFVSLPILSRLLLAPLAPACSFLLFFSYHRFSRVALRRSSPSVAPFACQSCCAVRVREAPKHETKALPARVATPCPVWGHGAEACWSSLLLQPEAICYVSQREGWCCFCLTQGLVRGLLAGRTNIHGVFQFQVQGEERESRCRTAPLG